MTTDGFAIFNSTGDTIPPGAAVEPTGVVDADGRIVVRKPTVANSLSVLINGPAQVLTGGVGYARSPYPACVYAVHASDTPADRELVGTKAGDWYLRTGQKGFLTIGGFDAHRFANAVPDPAPGGPVVTRDIPTNVCAVLDTYGAITGIRVEYTPVTFPAGTTFGSPTCAVNPTNCCPVTITCGACETPIALPANAFLNFVSTTGAATCLPASVPLTVVGDVASTGGFFTPPKAGWVVQGASQTAGAGYGETDYCGGTYHEVVLLWLECGETGFTVNYVGAAYPTVFTMGPLNGTLATAEQPCDLFATSGTLFLGTITHSGLGIPPDSSLDMWLSWEV